MDFDIFKCQNEICRTSWEEEKGRGYIQVKITNYLMDTITEQS